MKSQRAYVTRELFSFFRDLAKHNDRGWFEKNRARYLEHVRDPLLALVSDFEPRLHRINPHLVADPRPSGGALFRIHRDVRFSRDKSPYKTHAGLRFPHEDGKDVHAPGFYLHLEPDQVFVGGGIWHPDGSTLRSVRDAIVADPKAWRRATSGKAFRERCRLGGDSLKRPPRGYDAQHPFVEDLKRTDFIAITELDEAEACRPDFPKRLGDACRAMKPFVGFLARAVRIPW